MNISFLIPFFLFPLLRILSVFDPAIQMELPNTAYFSPVYEIRIDTLINCNTLAEYVPDWTGEKIGVDVRYIHDADDFWQCVFLIDSTVLKFTELDSLPLVIPITRAPTHFSISRSSGFVLVYQQMNTGDTARFLNLIDLNSGEVTDFQVENTYNLQSEPNGALVTDDGHVVTYRRDIYEFSGGRVRISQTESLLSQGFQRLAFHSEVGNRIVTMRQDLYNCEGFILSTSLDTIAHFDPGRQFPKPTISNSGDKVLYSSSCGISSFNLVDGRIVSCLFSCSGTQAPVVSLSDVYWACAFDQSEENGESHEVVIIGDVDDISSYRTVLTKTSTMYANTRVLSVSDSGFIICSISLSDDRFTGAYRYLLLNRNGYSIWVSEIICSMFHTPKLGGNAHVPLVETLPKLVCISPDGDRLIYYNNGSIVEMKYEIRAGLIEYCLSLLNYR